MGRNEELAVVVDAGPLIHLDELQCLDLLADLAPLVTPEIVWRETRQHRPFLQPDQIPGLQRVSVGLVASPRLAVFVDTLGLAAGEVAALALAEQKGLRMFLTDDSAARLAGESLGLRVHGTIGILVRGIRRGLRSREQVLDVLAHIRERSTLHIGQSLLAEVISLVAEDGREA
jgi:predicted nucleic acid-binding protein